jgi:hypothetical protein
MIPPERRHGHATGGRQPSAVDQVANGRTDARREAVVVGAENERRRSGTGGRAHGRGLTARLSARSSGIGACPVNRVRIRFIRPSGFRGDRSKVRKGMQIRRTEWLLIPGAEEFDRHSGNVGPRPRRCWATAQPTKQEPVGWTMAQQTRSAQVDVFGLQGSRTGSRSGTGRSGPGPGGGVKGKQEVDGLVRNRFQGAKGIDEGSLGTDVTFFGAPLIGQYQQVDRIAVA